MKLLRSMTGASPETRLVFLTWACFLGNNFQHGKKDDLAAALQVSKRHLDVALEYLVREGYLWKINSSVKPMMGEKRGGRFDYGITSKAWEMWLELLSACCWKEELHLILIRRYAVGKVKAEKPSHFTAKMRLVWIALMLSSNKAGYVLAIENSFFSKVLGMTEAQIRRTVRALVRVGVVSVVAAKLARTTLFGSMLPVYKVHPQSSQWKIVRVGITRNDMEFDPIRLLRHLISYEQVATVHMCSKKGKLPIQSSCFLDDQYFRLSKHFRSMKLKAIVQQACLAIVFSHALNNLAARLSGASRPHGGQNSLSEPHQATLTIVNQPANYQDLCCRVSFELSNSLSCGDVVSFEKMEQEEGGLNKKTENEIFRAFIINELTIDIVDLIQQLTKELQVFVDCFGNRLRVMNHQKHHFMCATLPAQEAPFKQSQDTDSSEEANNLIVSHVLEVLVPNEDKYGDCLIYDGELFMANSRVKHSKIRQVDKLICYRVSSQPKDS